MFEIFFFFLNILNHLLPQPLNVLHLLRCEVHVTLVADNDVVELQQGHCHQKVLGADYHLERHVQYGLVINDLFFN